MAFDLIIIEIPELGERIQISRALVYKLLLASASDFSGTTFTQDRRVANEYVLQAPKVCDYIPAWITKEEKLRRMRRGWRPYFLPVIVPPVLPVRRRVQSNLGNHNIGCRNFKRMSQ